MKLIPEDILKYLIKGSVRQSGATCTVTTYDVPDGYQLSCDSQDVYMIMQYESQANGTYYKLYSNDLDSPAELNETMQYEWRLYKEVALEAG